METTVRNVAVCPIARSRWWAPARSISRSFRDLADDERGQALVRSMITLSHDLGYRVVAEGVETAAAAAILADLECEEAQGLLFCPSDEGRSAAAMARCLSARIICCSLTDT
ncbi:MAG TPA: EAL domain-containing protein [Aurantimonas sp.]|jgi:EAL domain-containing protein (putative c-di-GMP-specific phosphodiesterase class I)|nr:EAL domain-containing protein [Aurantimonas sp.]